MWGSRFQTALPLTRATRRIIPSALLSALHFAVDGEMVLAFVFRP